MTRLADDLEALCGAARKRVVLVSPFAKRPVVDTLLAATAPGVPVSVVVRWVPCDIKAGVTDLEVWDSVRARPETDLFLRHDLHAKYYRGDEHCLVGSANLTGAALGLSPVSNFELLVPVHLDHVAIAGFEDELFAAAVEVDEDLVAVTRAAVDELPSFLAVEASESSPRLPSRLAAPRPETWIPMLRQPADLYLAYRGDEDDLSSVASRSAAADLAVLRVPPGLDEPGFHAYVAAALLHMPLAAAVDKFVREPRRFGEVRDLVRHRLGLEGSATREWQVLFRWLVHFLPDRFEYRRPKHSELIVRRPRS